MVTKTPTHKVTVIPKGETAWQIRYTSSNGNFKWEFIRGRKDLKMNFTSSLKNAKMKQCFWVAIIKAVI